MNNIELSDIKNLFLTENNFYILTHKSPDGDTLGSAFALCLILQKLNKKVKVLCSDEIPEKYNLLFNLKLHKLNTSIKSLNDTRINSKKFDNFFDLELKKLNNKLNILSNNILSLKKYILAFETEIQKLKNKLENYYKNKDIKKQVISYLDDIINNNFEPKCIVSVDVADQKLLGKNLQQYADKINLCIDHHKSNSIDAKYCYIDRNSAATAEIIYKIAKALDVEITSNIATCIYTGISTDTGCFRHSNATSMSYKIAGEMINYGANAFKINKLMFDSKSKTAFYLERLAMNSMAFCCNDKFTYTILNYEDIKDLDINESDYDGLSEMLLHFSGVLVGARIVEKEPGIFSASVRSTGQIDVSAICEQFNGGGHKCAAGCTIEGNLSDVKSLFLSEIKLAVTKFKQ